MNNLKNEIDLFIGFTPFHSFVCKQLIEETENSVYCIFTKGWPHATKKYHKIGYFPRSRLLRSFFYPLSLLLFSIYIKLILSKKSINVYIPHPKNPFTNFVTHIRVNSINLYEDGIMNYYDVNSKIYKVNTIHRKLMNLFNIKYKDYEGHLTGIEYLQVEKYYLTRPKYAVLTDKVEKTIHFTLFKKSNKIVKKRILFLDQRTDNFFPQQLRKEKLDEMFKLYSPSEYNYFYKPHHDYNDNFPIINRISKDLESKPAEEVVEILSPEIVISFFSSALINIKISHPDIKCYWLAADMIEIYRNKELTYLSSIFIEANVMKIEKETNGIH